MCSTELIFLKVVGLAQYYALIAMHANIELDALLFYAMLYKFIFGT